MKFVFNKEHSRPAPLTCQIPDPKFEMSGPALSGQ